MRLSEKEERLLDLSSRLLLQERREALCAGMSVVAVSDGRRPVTGTRSSSSPV